YSPLLMGVNGLTGFWGGGRALSAASAVGAFSLPGERQFLGVVRLALDAAPDHARELLQILEVRGLDAIRPDAQPQRLFDVGGGGGRRDHQDRQRPGVDAGAEPGEDFEPR